MVTFGWQGTMYMPATRGVNVAWHLLAAHFCLRQITMSPTTAAVYALRTTPRYSPHRVRNLWRPLGVLPVRRLRMLSAIQSAATAT